MHDRSAETAALKENMALIRHKILVLSGKGGVGKSTVAVNLAFSLLLADRRVGLLDIDIHGPSIPKLLRLEGHSLAFTGGKIIPAGFGEKLKVVSIGFLTSGDGEAVIWRGPMKANLIRQFLADVQWGELDFLVIDSPPGTGDEPLSACQLIENPTGAVIVTTPQELAVADVRKSINFCSKLDMPVIGIVENMSGFICPHCGNETLLFKSGGGELLSHETGVPFLGRVPLDPELVDSCDSGRPYLSHYSKSSTAGAFEKAFRPILELDQSFTK